MEGMLEETESEYKHNLMTLRGGEYNPDLVAIVEKDKLSEKTVDAWRQNIKKIVEVLIHEPEWLKVFSNQLKRNPALATLGFTVLLTMFLTEGCKGCNDTENINKVAFDEYLDRQTLQTMGIENCTNTCKDNTFLNGYVKDNKLFAFWSGNCSHPRKGELISTQINLINNFCGEQKVVREGYETVIRGDKIYTTTQGLLYEATIDQNTNVIGEFKPITLPGSFSHIGGFSFYKNRLYSNDNMNTSSIDFETKDPSSIIPTHSDLISVPIENKFGKGVFDGGNGIKIKRLEMNEDGKFIKMEELEISGWPTQCLPNGLLFYNAFEGGFAKNKVYDLNTGEIVNSGESTDDGSENSDEVGGSSVDNGSDGTDAKTHEKGDDSSGGGTEHETKVAESSADSEQGGESGTGGSYEINLSSDEVESFMGESTIAQGSEEPSSDTATEWGKRDDDRDGYPNWSDRVPDCAGPDVMEVDGNTYWYGGMELTTGKYKTHNNLLQIDVRERGNAIVYTNFCTLPKAYNGIDAAKTYGYEGDIRLYEIHINPAKTNMRLKDTTPYAAYMIYLGGKAERGVVLGTYGTDFEVKGDIDSNNNWMVTVPFLDGSGFAFKIEDGQIITEYKEEFPVFIDEGKSVYFVMNEQNEVIYSQLIKNGEEPDDYTKYIDGTGDESEGNTDEIIDETNNKPIEKDDGGDDDGCSTINNVENKNPLGAAILMFGSLIATRIFGSKKRDEEIRSESDYNGARF
ncbi:hypothetical protein A2229_00920 [Candidatus Peregrinibacteria bacterium RIFOXYA2_FULL_33_7]|nr:MAG: hypothetical protein A2229_00920 [Candidatus Peregrinibacteria bacterium RIFOXYA2_FULL_33_7]